MVVQQPYELLDLSPGGTAEFTILAMEEGQTVIKPVYEGAPLEKLVPDLRLTVDPKDKPLGPPYWDVTSLTLQLQLRSIVSATGLPVRVKITKVGEAPKARFMVEAKAPGGPSAVSVQT